MFVYWRRKWQPIPGFLPGEFHGQRNLAGYSPWGCKDSDSTNAFSFIFNWNHHWNIVNPKGFLVPSEFSPCSTPTLALGDHWGLLLILTVSQFHILLGLSSPNCTLFTIFYFSHYVCGRCINSIQKFGWMHSWPSEQPLGARLPLNGIWTPHPRSPRGSVSCWWFPNPQE